MTDAEPLRLLREIIDTTVQNNAFPRSAAVRASKLNEPWLVDELLRQDWLREYLGFLVPTLAGLRAAETSSATRTLDEIRNLLPRLRQMYTEDPDRTWRPQEVAHPLGDNPPHAAFLLTVIAKSLPVVGGYTTDGQTPLLLGFQLTPKVLEDDLFPEASGEERPAASAPITVLAKDFRGLADVSFSPSGVCLIAGPNGSGKSSLLEILAFLRDAFLRGIPQAVRFQRGAAGLRRIEANGPPEVLLALTVGEAPWELHVPINNGSVGEFAGEVVKVGPSIRVRRSTYSPEWYLGQERRGPDREGRTSFRVAWDANQSLALSGLVEALRGFRFHAGYALETLRDGGTGGEDDEHLHPNGQNLFIVLRNWKAAPRRFENRFEWVLGQMRRAFPGLIDTVEFDPPVGQVVPARFFKPDSRVGLPMSRAADGMLVGLLHLTAVASANNGSIVAIDEMENQLHPHAIRSILAAMRELSDERDLTVLLTTHSPVLMNAFKEHPEQFYVMEPGQPTLPVALDKLHNPDWLAHFALGDLYDRMEFGAPPHPEGG